MFRHPLYSNIFVLALIQCGDRLKSSEYDVCRRQIMTTKVYRRQILTTKVYRCQILTTKVYPRTVRIKIFLLAVDPEHRYSNESERDE